MLKRQPGLIVIESIVRPLYHRRPAAETEHMTEDIPRKHSVAGVLVDEVDYARAVDRIGHAAVEGRPYAVTALAVHGVMTGVDDEVHRYRLNHFDLVAPDGQPVRWALRWLHHVRLADRVYGPNLTLFVAEWAARNGVPVYFYGSTQPVLDRLLPNMVKKFPSLKIAGSQPSQFRTGDLDDLKKTAEQIKATGARIVFVGLGCPRQEVFSFHARDYLGVPVLAVGAAFDYHAGNLKQPPALMQRWGLEWLWRLGLEPRRLWRRYLILNPRFLIAVGRQKLGRKELTADRSPTDPQIPL